MTDLTVVCSFRNVDRYLPDLLESLSRTRCDFAVQFVFVDDASTDRSLDVIDEFETRLPGAVDVIVNDIARGPAHGRNAGMRAADGRHLAFIDGDDWVGPDYFSELMWWIDELDVDFVRTDHVRVFKDKRRLGRAPDPRYYRRLDPSSAVLPATESTMVDFPYSHSGIFSRRLLDDGLLLMPESLRTAEDRPWIWRLHLEAESYARIESLKYFYRRDVPSSLTQVGDDRQLDFIPSFTQVIDYVYSTEQFERYRRKAVRQMLSVTHHHLVNAARLHPGLEAEMRHRLLALIERVEEADLATGLADLGWRRADLVRELDPRLQTL